MHVPDGFLDFKTASIAGVLAAAGVGLAMRQARSLPRRQVPLLGTTAAFVFAAQMLNFPIGGGASGHLVGAGLATVLVGPGGAIIVLTSVLLVQCLLFADGGITALGANVFNMAVVGALGSYLPYRSLRRLLPGERGAVAAGCFAAWCSIVLASAFCAAELALSGTARWDAIFPTMTGLHMIIGLGEGAITGLVLWSVMRARPELLDAASEPVPARPLVGFGLVVALGLVVFLAPFASPLPDGLEHTAQGLGFAPRATAAAAPIPDYAVPWISSPLWAGIAAGVTGTVVALGLSWFFARAIVPARSRG